MLGNRNTPVWGRLQGEGEFILRERWKGRNLTNEQPRRKSFTENKLCLFSDEAIHQIFIKDPAEKYSPYYWQWEAVRLAFFQTES